MPGEEIPDPPIPDVPEYTPIPRRGAYSARVRPGTGLVPGGPVIPATYAPADLDIGDLVKVSPALSPAAKHTGAIGTITKFRPALSTGVRPVTLHLTVGCPCGCAPAGGDILVSDDRLELMRRAAHMPAAAAKAPAKATLPSLRPGDRVRILRLPSGVVLRTPHFGTVDRSEADPARYLVDDDDGGRGWYPPGDLEPAPTGILDEPTWPEPDPEPPPPPPGVSTEYPEPKPRYLFVAIPLTDDPADDPRDPTELIDLIAERHEHIRFEAHELTDPEEET